MSTPVFTTEVLDWKAWIDTVDVSTASEEQAAVLAEGGAHAKTSAYYHLLLHNAPVLRERSKLFNAVMYGTSGLPRADRELGATAESILNGCVYCTSVHARFYNQLSKGTAVIERLFANGLDAELERRERAVVDFAVGLSQTPPAVAAEDVAALRDVGLDDRDILDLCDAVAMFAWANRLMLTLGEPVATEAIR